MPILIAVAVLIGLVVRWGLDAAARVSDRGVVSEILRATRGPAIFGAVTAIVSVASSTLFVFSGRIDAALDPLIAIGITASVLWLFVNAIDVLLDRLVDFDGTDLSGNAERTKRSVATKVAAARRALIVIAVAIGAGTVLTTSNLLQNLGLSILGTAGALTLILAFAARRVLGNIMSSLQIALNQSARIGDRIVYKDHLCHVERINFTFVQLRDWDGTRLVVPVEDFVSEAFENWTMQEPEMLRIIKIKMAHGADVEELRTVFDEVIEGLDQEELGDLDKVKVRVADQDVFGKDVWFCLPCADPNTSWDIACQAREEIIARAAKREETGDDRMFPEANPAEAA
ncbi:mechanosensitive ion channel family protein [Ovoidimarina sediminis]|uniref:mechanosensitive ion channel family protein n=1 Tax=Ovoidimarina sediminis TaxID=3079856 RepID=UPI00290E26FB|nr:mechanosensitive ion channel domain-containing protein [Rhodophyticola sp. MJ-SS7]MDU8945166.1 mechanosensitive ion channel [Rhodophyticola sp. MJ-SS7]